MYFEATMPGMFVVMYLYLFIFLQNKYFCDLNSTHFYWPYLRINNTFWNMKPWLRGELWNNHYLEMTFPLFWNNDWR